jgi:AcrR family transcriptional regulator
MRKPEKLEELLHAAHNVVVRDGVTRLTLELVAREAGVSKGAVLYYFPTKNALIGQMLHTWMDCHQRDWHAAIERQPEGPGRKTRALLSLITTPDAMDERGGAGMLAAIANDPELLSVLREKIGDWQKQLADDDIDPTVAQLVRFVMDGVKFSEIMGINPPNNETRQLLVSYLNQLILKPETL